MFLCIFDLFTDFKHFQLSSHFNCFQLSKADYIKDLVYKEHETKQGYNRKCCEK